MCRAKLRAVGGAGPTADLGRHLPGERGRGLVAALGTVLAIGLGVIGATSFNNLPPIVSGGIGALVATVVYAAAWHIGLAVARRA